MPFRKILGVTAPYRPVRTSVNGALRFSRYRQTLFTTFVCERSGPTEKMDSGTPVN